MPYQGKLEYAEHPQSAPIEMLYFVALDLCECLEPNPRDAPKGALSRGDSDMLHVIEEFSPSGFLQSVCSIVPWHLCCLYRQVG